VSGVAWEACYFGSSAAARDRLADTLGVTVHRGIPEDASRVDCVFVEAAGGEGLPGGNAFTACRRFKDQSGWRVFVLVEAGDVITPEIARFCLADGSFELGADGLIAGDADILERLVRHRPRVSMDALLSRLEKEIASDEGREASALQRMLEDERGQNLLDRLVDRETGLFDGPFASFKLDEEFKRSVRFHQPLSLLLLDIGVDVTSPSLGADRRQGYLAEVAAVFLNECRDIDIIGRFTESTFMVLLPGTGAAGSEILARRMLQGVKERGQSSGVGGSPTAGLATMPAAGIHNRQAFLARAEACLQLAREGQGQEGFCAYSE
jgi:GGDEF domain-containing protein